MTGQQRHTANAQQSYTLASRTSQRTDQSLPKSMPAPVRRSVPLRRGTPGVPPDYPPTSTFSI